MFVNDPQGKRWMVLEGDHAFEKLKYLHRRGVRAPVLPLSEIYPGGPDFEISEEKVVEDLHAAVLRKDHDAVRSLVSQFQLIQSTEILSEKAG